MLWPHTYIPGFIQIRSGLGSHNRKTLPQPPKVILIQALQAYNNKEKATRRGLTSSIYVANCPRTEVSMLSSDSRGNLYTELNKNTPN